jgi:hypothetical protein
MSCMAITTHTMVVELSHEVVVSFMRWLFCEATTSFSLIALFPPHHQKSYSLRPKKNDVLGFKICPKNDVLLNLACVHVHVGMQQSVST